MTICGHVKADTAAVIARPMAIHGCGPEYSLLDGDYRYPLFVVNIPNVVPSLLVFTNLSLANGHYDFAAGTVPLNIVRAGASIDLESKDKGGGCICILSAHGVTVSHVVFRSCSSKVGADGAATLRLEPCQFMWCMCGLGSIT